MQAGFKRKALVFEKRGPGWGATLCAILISPGRE